MIPQDKEEFKMDITITGYDGENVIAQIIEDLLTVNGLSVKREDFSAVHANLSIEQLDRQIGLFKKNKVEFTIKVVKEEKPKYSPKAKISKFKPNLPDMANIIGRTAARLNEVRADRAIGLDNDGLDELFVDPPVAVPAPAAPVAPRYVAEAPAYYGGYGQPRPAVAAPQGIVDALAAQVAARREQMAAQVADAGADLARIRQDLAALAANRIGEQEVADEMPVAVMPAPYEYVPAQWAAPRRGRN